MAPRSTKQGLAIALALLGSMLVVGLPALLIKLDWITVDQVIFGLLIFTTALMVLLTGFVFLQLGWQLWSSHRRNPPGASPGRWKRLVLWLRHSPTSSGQFVVKMVIGMFLAGMPLLLWQLGRSGWITKHGVLMAMMILLSLLALMGFGVSCLPLIQFLRHKRSSAPSPTNQGWLKNLCKRAFALPSQLFWFLWRLTGRKSFLTVVALSLLAIGLWYLGNAGWLRQCLIGLTSLMVIMQVWAVFRSADTPTRMKRLKHLAVLLVPLAVLAAWGFVYPATSLVSTASPAPATPAGSPSSSIVTDSDTAQRLILIVAVSLATLALLVLAFLLFRHLQSRSGTTGGGRNARRSFFAFVGVAAGVGFWYFFPQLASTFFSTPPPAITTAPTPATTTTPASATTAATAPTPSSTPNLQQFLKKNVLTLSSLDYKNFVGLSVPKYARVIVLEDMPELEDLQGLTGYAVELRCLRCPKLVSAAGFSSSVKTVLFEDCPLLPSLTGLSTEVTDVYVKNCRNFKSVGLLPGSLALLECSGCPLEDLSGLGSNVKQFGCTDCYGNLDLATMPAGIRNVALRNCRSVRNLSTLKGGIETLDISGSGISDLTGAPEGIVKITLRGCPNLVNLVGAPSSLLELDCSGSPNLTSLEGLREGIETIKTGSCPNLKLLGRLPRSLRRIVSHVSYFSDFQQIPPGAVWEDR